MPMKEEGRHHHHARVIVRHPNPPRRYPNYHRLLCESPSLKPSATTLQRSSIYHFLQAEMIKIYQDQGTSRYFDVGTKNTKTYKYHNWMPDVATFRVSWPKGRHGYAQPKCSTPGSAKITLIWPELGHFLSIWVSKWSPNRGMTHGTWYHVTHPGMWPNYSHVGPGM